MTPQPRGFAGPDAPDLEIANRCVRCGLCLPHCPTYRETSRETSSPRGRIHLIESVGRGRLDLLSTGFVAQMHECLNCRACEAVCPSGVEYGQLVEAARAQIARAQADAPQQRAGAAALQGIFGDMRRFRALMALIRVYQRAGGRWLARGAGLLRALGLAESEAMLPDLPGAFVIPTDQRYEPAPDLPPRPSVALFTGCIMSTILAATDRATIRVLTALGHSVTLPAGQGCCGALSTHSGYPDQARALARRTIATFEQSGAEIIVNNAAGCGAALKEYGHLLAGDPAWAERAAAFSARVRDLTEALVDGHTTGTPLQAHASGTPQPDNAGWTRFQPLRLRVTYQEPCHLAHAQRITRPPRDLLRAIPGLELVEMEETALCCGSAGIYNLTQPEMAGRLQRRKVAHATATGADLVVTANPGCYLQVRAGLRAAHSPMGILHIADLLDASLRGMTPETVMQMARPS